MDPRIARRRLRNQHLVGPPCRNPGDVVTWMGAVQAQEFAPALWGLAQRLDAAWREDLVERAFQDGEILRTHVLRPTWHFVPALDIRWMLELTGPRVQLRMAPYNRHLELDARILTRAAAVFERALRDGRCLTRNELGARLARAGIAATGQRLAHIAMHAELEGIVCSGPRKDRQFTYALLAERAPRARRRDRDEALAELTRRYFRSHGPATVRDFVWWSGLRTDDAKRGLDMIRAGREMAGNLTYWSGDESDAGRIRAAPAHLLPVYDEYLVAYRDREAVPHFALGLTAADRPAGFQHPFVVRGQLAGVWRPVRGGAAVTVEVLVAAKPRASDRTGLEQAAARYSECLGLPVSISLRLPARVSPDALRKSSPSRA